MKKLAIVTTHPIQYNAPWFSLLSKRGKILPGVFYTWQRNEKRLDIGFGKEVVWDIPLLAGYEYYFVENGGNTKHGFWDVKNTGLNKAIEDWGAEAVLVFGWNYLSHLKAILYFKGKIPVLFRGDSHLLDENNRLKKMVRKLWLNWVYKHIDYGLYVGLANKQYYLNNGLNESKLIFTPHAVDINRFSNNAAVHEEDAGQWRATLGIKEGTIVFLFAGKLIPKKDPELLIHSFIALEAANTALVLAGNGILETMLKEKYAHHSNIYFVDFQNQTRMPVLYRMGDIFVLPSKGPGETWGLAVNEAMACGKPVIVSDACGCATDLVKPGINGYVFKKGDLIDLKDAMAKCLPLNPDMGIASRGIIGQWSYMAIADSIELLINKL